MSDFKKLREKLSLEAEKKKMSDAYGMAVCREARENTWQDMASKITRTGKIQLRQTLQQINAHTANGTTCPMCLSVDCVFNHAFVQCMRSCFLVPNVNSTAAETMWIEITAGFVRAFYQGILWAEFDVQRRKINYFFEEIPEFEMTALSVLTLLKHLEFFYLSSLGDLAVHNIHRYTDESWS
jgi:hypothetical protein